MPTTAGPVKVASAAPALALVFITAVVWVLRGYVWPTLSNVEVDVLRALLDPSLFRQDFSVQASLGFTPRYYYNALILAPTRAGLPLEWAFALWQLVALATLLSGVRALARTLGLGEIATAIVIVWLLTVSVGTVGMVYFYTHAPVPAVWAGALVAWGAAWAWRGRWTAAYACFGAATLLQFLVGLYAGVLALPALFMTRRWGGWRALIPWWLGLALVYVPMRLTGGTGSSGLDDAGFVSLYAQVRHPHHLVPSSWGWPFWVQAVSFYVGACYFLRRTRAGRPATEQWLLVVTMGLMAAALGLNYYFVEVHPLALIAKLQPARITPLVQCLVLMLLATRVQVLAVRRDWLSLVSLCLIPFTAVPGFLLLLAAVLLPGADRDSRTGWARILLLLAVVLAFQPFDPSLPARALRYGLWAALFALQLLPARFEHRPGLLAGLAALAVAGAAVCAVGSLRPDWPAFLTARFALNARPVDPPGILGQRFEARSAKDALVLVPPTDEPWAFKLYARRALVVDNKSSPFTEQGLMEWRDRMARVLGTAPAPGVDSVAAWSGRSPESLRALAEHYGARYVLTRDAWHPALPGRRIDHEADWSLWELPGN